MFKKSKNQERVKVDFTKGCAILPDGRERPLYVSKKGVWFRCRFKSIVLNETNCVISQRKEQNNGL